MKLNAHRRTTIDHSPPLEFLRSIRSRAAVLATVVISIVLCATALAFAGQPAHVHDTAPVVAGESAHVHGAAPAAAAGSVAPTAATPEKGHEGHEGHASVPLKPAPKSAPLAGKMVSIKNGAESLAAYLSLPKGAGPHPAVIVIQEWWGLNDQIKSVADTFASKGYVALAPDLYQGKVTTDPAVAMELLRALPESRGLGDLSAAFAYLRALPAVGTRPIGSIGFCMGGGFSLGLAIQEPKLTACVVCYGRPVSDPEKIKTIAAPVLGIYGGQDKGIPQEMIDGFRKAMETAGKSIDIKVYPEAGHGFMNPNNPGHKATETGDAWTRIDAFFAKLLKP